MQLLVDYLREVRSEASSGWNRFWFSAADGTTLCLIRIACGAMLLYTHAVWTLRLDAFFGDKAWISPSAISTAGISPWAWSHLWLIHDPTTLRIAHFAALAVFAMFTLGLFTRATNVLSWLLVVSYAHRANGALFGLDQINAMLSMYLMFANCGDQFSLDSLLWRRPQPAPATINNNIAARLIQVNLAILYLFAGISKLQGPAWWDGSAMWLAVSNYEYQSIDMTWLVNYPTLVNALTHITIVWEVSYIALVWPRLTRPIVIFLAIPLHLGIAFCLGMTTFGTIMLAANAAFIPGEIMRRMIGLKSAAAIAAEAAAYERDLDSRFARHLARLDQAGRVSPPHLSQPHVPMSPQPRDSVGREPRRNLPR